MNSSPISNKPAATSKNHEDPLQLATINWQNSFAFSNKFEESYYKNSSELEGFSNLFIKGNTLKERWQSLGDNDHFTIAEIGFGTGVNFLSSVNLWLRLAPPQAQLRFISVEKHPLTASQLQQVWQHWPQRKHLSSPLIKHYPPLVKGFHQRLLFNKRIQLLLIFDDAYQGLNQLQASNHPYFQHRGNSKVNAWFLDGFSPNKNPEAWSSRVFQSVANLSNSNTSFAASSTTQEVVDGLNSITARYHREQDSLYGHFSEPKNTFTNRLNTKNKAARNSPFEPTWHLFLDKKPPSSKQHVIVVGGGIAGCSTAAALKRRGWQVSLIDKHSNVGQEASGNPQGILYPKLSVQQSALTNFGLHSLCYAQHFYQDYWQSHYTGAASGVLVVPQSPKEKQQFQDIGQRFSQSPELVSLVMNETFQQLTGVKLQAEMGLWFSRLGWVSPPEVCQWLSKDINKIQAHVHTLSQDSNGHWQLTDSQGHTIASAPVVVLATSVNTALFEQARHLPLRKIRGQVSGIATTAASAALSAVICGAGYIAPAAKGLHTMGATYHLDDGDIDIRQSDHHLNRATLAKTDNALPLLFSAQQPSFGRAGIRCSTPDYLPIAGAAPHQQQMEQRFAALSRNAKAHIMEPSSNHQGLWLNCGYGSRGLTYAPMVAEALAAQISGEQPPLPRSLMMALHPARFIIRALKKAHP